MRLVLASTSPFRAALLERLGLRFEVAAPRFDERMDASVFAGSDDAPDAIARAFALGKARSLAGAYAHAGPTLLIGSDQVLALGRDGASVFRKPMSREEALAQLVALSGRTHTLTTAVAVVDAQSAEARVDAIRVSLTMRALGADALARYLDHEDTRGSVGGYRFEGRGVALFESVVGIDDSAIVGLPLVLVSRLLRQFDVDPLG